MPGEVFATTDDNRIVTLWFGHRHLPSGQSIAAGSALHPHIANGTIAGTGPPWDPVGGSREQLMLSMLREESNFRCSPCAFADRTASSTLSPSPIGTAALQRIEKRFLARARALRHQGGVKKTASKAIDGRNVLRYQRPYFAALNRLGLRVLARGGRQCFM